MRSHSEAPVVALIVGFLFLPLGAAPGVAQVAGLSAPGAPIVDCSDAAARYERLSSGLGVQREAIRREQALFDALREERTAGTREARDKLMARSADTLKSHAAEELEALKTAREKAWQLSAPADPLQAAARVKWMKQVSLLERSISSLLAIPDALGSGYEYGVEVQRQSHTVAEHLKAANTLFVDSGLAEAVGGELAKAGGPAGVVLFEGSLFLLDHLLADEGSWDRLLEEQRSAANLNTMQDSLHNVEEKLANLKQDCPAEFGKDTGTPSPATASTSFTPPTPPAAEQPAASAAKSSGGGKAAVAIIGAGAAVAGGIYAGKMLGDLAATTTGGSCASDRFCIVSVMSSGCSCAGSVRGGCDWTGPTASAGGSCGSGVPCASGLSCNNGRCEGSSGRCPF